MSNIGPIIPDNITYNDLKYRLQNIQCCLPNKAVELYNRINLGINCCNEERQLNIATAYLDMLKCYITNWETPYSYQTSFTEGPSLTFDVVVEFIEQSYNENSEIFNGFYLPDIGYSVTYPSPVAMSTIIEDYIENTGQNMELISFSSDTKQAIFTITMQIPCEDANISLDYYFIYEEMYAAFDKLDFGTCVNTLINIVGPTYQYQDSANCLTREEVVNMFEWLQKYCCMCFPNYGNYNPDNITIID